MASAHCRIAAHFAGLVVRHRPPQGSCQLTSLLAFCRTAPCRPTAPPSRPTAGRGSRAACSAAASHPRSSSKRQVVFLGTPDVASGVLQQLLEASQLPDASFEVAAVVSQPGRPRGRKRTIQPSPVDQLARDAGLPADRILCPERAGDPDFLEALRSLNPDLCITAAYGNYLPTAFLQIPRHGTLNIHPSLLPAYRGAAPVQRALLDGVQTTGVTVLYTVKEMDAGPILAQEAVSVDPNIQAPEFLTLLFRLGTQLLLSKLDAVWAGSAPAEAVPQDASQATHAAKTAREEGLLDFDQPAEACHNKVRGLAGWPGTYHPFVFVSEDGSEEVVELKVLQTEMQPAGGGAASADGSRSVQLSREALSVRCGDGRVLQLLQVQAPGKKPVGAQAVVNGLNGRTLRWQPVAAAAVAE